MHSGARFASGVAGAALIAGIITGSAVAAPTTGTFIDRASPSDLRIATYNVYEDSILSTTPMPTVGSRNARFTRMAAALDPDVWCFQEMYSNNATTVKQLLDAAQPLGNSTGWHVYRPTGNEHVIASKYPITMRQANTTPAGYRPVAMGLVDLPDGQFAHDLYLMNAHYRCCGDEANDPFRQQQSDAFVNWMRDARTPGGSITLVPNTPMMVLGDLNIVGGPQPLTTLLDGNIQSTSTYGADAPPDWDGTGNAIVDARHNLTGADTYTWRDDLQEFDPGRLDYMTYTDSVMSLRKSFVLNTLSMSPADLAASGLGQYDSIYNLQTYDHLPIFADFTIVPEPGCAALGAAGIAAMLVARPRSSTRRA